MLNKFKMSSLADKLNAKGAAEEALLKKGKKPPVKVEKRGKKPQKIKIKAKKKK